jgi:hypothetical protein
MSNILSNYQYEAVERIRNGCILNGGVGSGKSRTGLYYYFKEQGGCLNESKYTPMTKPKDLYIITTAMKRDRLEWQHEMLPFLFSSYPNLKVTVDSWNNIQKYKDVTGAFFLFDEDRVTGSGVWARTFIKISRKNDWIILSATPGDKWEDYAAVFVANGFYNNITEFRYEHCIFSPYIKGKVDRYINTRRLVRLRERILIEMDVERHTVPHHEDIYASYDRSLYREVGKNRWDPFKEEPIKSAAELCYLWRKIVNTDTSRQIALLEIFEKHPRLIVFYNFDYELDILKNLYYGEDVEIAEWNGHKHQPIPDSETWVYLVQYTAGCEGWNCITTNAIVFYSQNYSYKVMQQASGRIDRMNTPYTDLYYYHIRSRSGIDLAITKALTEKKRFNETKFTKWGKEK